MMHPAAFLKLAESLANGITEAEWRSSVSRAYYAGFHLGCQFLTELGFRIPKADRAHVFTSRRLSNCQYRPVAMGGSSLDDLRSWRNQCDYDLHRPIGKQLAENSVSAARLIFNAILESEQSSTVITMMTDVIRTYERDVLKDPTWQPPAK